MRFEDVPLSVRREIVREHYRAIQRRTTAKRLLNRPACLEQAKKASAARWNNRTQEEKDAHGKAMNKASVASYAKRREGQTAEQLLAKRREQKRASKARVKAGIKPQKTKRTDDQLALTPIDLLTPEAPPAPTYQPPPPHDFTCPRCGSPSDGGLCADCVLTLAAARHD